MVELATIWVVPLKNNLAVRLCSRQVSVADFIRPMSCRTDSAVNSAVNLLFFAMRIVLVNRYATRILLSPCIKF